MAIVHNISRNVEHHVLQSSPRFWVQATRNIQGKRRLIRPGYSVLIDPGMKPKDGSLVLVGDTPEQWAAGSPFAHDGVAIQIYSDAF